MLVTNLLLVVLELANFENFPMAMLTLFRISTGDNGSGMLKDAQRTSPDCSDDVKCEWNCCRWS